MYSVINSKNCNYSNKWIVEDPALHYTCSMTKTTTIPVKFTLVLLTTLASTILLLPGCGSGNNQQLPSGATITVSSCNANIVDTLSKMTSPSFNNLGVPDAITHYPNIVATGESEASYSWIGAKTTILFEWNTQSGSCIQQTSKG